MAEPVVQDAGDANRGFVTFDVPLSSALPSSSTAQAPADPPSVFAVHHVPEDKVNAAKEAIRQAGIMMEKVKMVRDASQAPMTPARLSRAMFRLVGRRLFC